MIKFLSFFSKSYILTLPFLIIFAGYSRNIPGKGGRYKVIGTNESGIWDLEIKNVSLQDDADYECQVGPANYNRPIRHRAHLHVLCKHTRSILYSIYVVIIFYYLPTYNDLFSAQCGKKLEQNLLKFPCKKNIEKKP